jgi:aryl-alcohol dehydrogenase-like predicted oxidoreductase
VALVRSKWFIATNIIGGTSIGQLTQNVDAADVALDDAIHTANDEIHHR